MKEVPGKRGPVFQVDGYTAQGKRVRKRHKTMEAAQGCIHRMEMADLRQPSRYTPQETYLTADQLREAERCFDMLPDGVTLTDAMTGFLRTYDPHVRTMTARDAFIEFLGLKETENVRERTLDNIRSRVGKFVEDLGNPVVYEIGETEVRKFLDQFSPITSKNYRVVINHFLEFCVHREYASQNILKKIRAQKIDRPDEVTILTVAQARRFLKAANDLHNGEVLPYVCIALLAGLRPDAELQVIRWEDMHMTDGDIHVRRTKNRNHVRFVAIHPTLRQWLGRCVGKPIITKNHRRKLAAIKQAAGFRGGLPGKRQKEIDSELEPWDGDTLRHSFGSYLLADKPDVAYVAAQMGNSPNTVMRYYRRAVKPAEAKRFWAVTPDNVLQGQLQELREVV